MKTPEQVADELAEVVQDHQREFLDGPVRDEFARIVRESLHGLADDNDRLRAENDLLRAGVWDSYLDHQAVADGAAKAARGQVAAWLAGQHDACASGAARLRDADAPPGQAAALASRAWAYENALNHLRELEGAPPVPLPPSQVEARVREVLAWAEAEVARAVATVAAVPACVVADRLREALGEDAKQEAGR